MKDKLDEFIKSEEKWLNQLGYTYFTPENKKLYDEFKKQLYANEQSKDE